MEDIELLRLLLNKAETALEQQEVFTNYLISAIIALGGVVGYLWFAYTKAVNKQLEMAKAGFELAESVKGVKDVSEKHIEKINDFEKSLINNKCSYVPPNQ